MQDEVVSEKGEGFAGGREDGLTEERGGELLLIPRSHGAAGPSVLAIH
jgi:hypothetical protein